MIKENTKFYKSIVENVRKIMIDRNITQAAMAEYMGMGAPQFSKIINGTVKLSLDNISNLATGLNMREIDIITYPEIYVSNCESASDDGMEAVLQIRLKKNKRDQVLNLIFGDNNIKILNN